MRSPRLLGLACLALVAAAGVLWGASQAVWFRVAAGLPGREVVEVTGAQVNGVLGGVALVALAGVAGVVATGGVPRRAVGLLLLGAGLAVGWVAVVAFAVDPFATDGAVPAPPDVDADLLRYRPGEPTAAPLLAALGALLLVAAGLIPLLAERRLPRFGARYAAPGARAVTADPDRAAWQDLDAGRDPTDP